MISFEVMLSCAQARLYFGQDLNRGHVLISLPYLRILFCSFCLDVILHLLYFGFSFRAVSPPRAGYFSLMACDNTQDSVAQIAREVPNYSQVLFPKDVPTLEVRFQVFGNFWVMRSDEFSEGPNSIFLSDLQCDARSV